MKLKTWAKRDFDEWAKYWAHENYVFKMFSGYGDSIQYGENLRLGFSKSRCQVLF